MLSARSRQTGFPTARESFSQAVNRVTVRGFTLSGPMEQEHRGQLPARESACTESEVLFPPIANLLPPWGPIRRWRCIRWRAANPTPIPGIARGELPVRWSADGDKLYLFRHEDAAATVFQLDVRTGRRVLWKRLVPSDPSGVREILSAVVAPDLKSYVYTYNRTLSELYLVEGLK